jgi:hypothetical protein
MSRKTHHPVRRYFGHHERDVEPGILQVLVLPLLFGRGVVPLPRRLEIGPELGRPAQLVAELLLLPLLRGEGPVHRQSRLGLRGARHLRLVVLVGRHGVLDAHPHPVGQLALAAGGRRPGADDPHGGHLARVGPDRHLEEEQAEDRRPADQVTDAEELFGGELAVGELGAEEHRDQRADVERPEDEGVLQDGELEAEDVIEPEFEPRAPDEDLHEHHQGQLAAQGLLPRGGERIGGHYGLRVRTAACEDCR